MRRKRRPLAALAIVALIGAGCSNTPAETSNSSAGSGKTTTNRDKAMRFAECMRDNGISEFPDPNASGEFVYGVSVGPAMFKKAVDACKDLQPPGTLTAERGPEQQKDRAAYPYVPRTLHQDSPSSR